jgi:predicted RNase H-like HicB family nuclease
LRRHHQFFEEKDGKVDFEAGGIKIKVIKMKNKSYIALLEYDDNPGYNVVFPDLPGCYSAGDTYDEAVRNAHEALSLHLDGEDNIPEPRTIEQIKLGWADWNDWEKDGKFLVAGIDLLPMKPKTRKFNISIDERLVLRIDRATRNRSGFIVEAIERMLDGGKNGDMRRLQQ